MCAEGGLADAGAAGCGIVDGFGEGGGLGLAWVRVESSVGRGREGDGAGECGVDEGEYGKVGG